MSPQSWTMSHWKTFRNSPSRLRGNAALQATIAAVGFAGVVVTVLTSYHMAVWVWSTASLVTFLVVWVLSVALDMHGIEIQSEEAMHTFLAEADSRLAKPTQEAGVVALATVKPDPILIRAQGSGLLPLSSQWQPSQKGQWPPRKPSHEFDAIVRLISELVSVASAVILPFADPREKQNWRVNVWETREVKSQIWLWRVAYTGEKLSSKQATYRLEQRDIIAKCFSNSHLRTGIPDELAKVADDASPYTHSAAWLVAIHKATAKRPVILAVSLDMTSDAEGEETQTMPSPVRSLGQILTDRLRDVYERY